jgi:hypothetical protein
MFPAGTGDSSCRAPGLRHARQGAPSKASKDKSVGKADVRNFFSGVFLTSAVFLCASVPLSPNVGLDALCLLERQIRVLLLNTNCVMES